MTVMEGAGHCAQPPPPRPLAAVAVTVTVTGDLSETAVARRWPGAPQHQRSRPPVQLG
jgi:hypothetical protein